MIGTLYVFLFQYLFLFSLVAKITLSNELKKREVDVIGDADLEQQSDPQYDTTSTSSISSSTSTKREDTSSSSVFASIQIKLTNKTTDNNSQSILLDKLMSSSSNNDNNKNTQKYEYEEASIDREPLLINANAFEENSSDSGTSNNNNNNDEIVNSKTSILSTIIPTTTAAPVTSYTKDDSVIIADIELNKPKNSNVSFIVIYVGDETTTVDDTSTNPTSINENNDSTIDNADALTTIVKNSLSSQDDNLQTTSPATDISPNIETTASVTSQVTPLPDPQFIKCANACGADHECIRKECLSDSTYFG